jgi:FMN phosphatase YigB (HAD superfamily)
VTSARHREPAEGRALRAISFDFGNTLCAVSDEALRTVLLDAADRIAARSGPFAVDGFVEAWREEARRQFAVNVPLGRENDLAERVVRVLARLRGMEAPPLPEQVGEGRPGPEPHPIGYQPLPAGAVPPRSGWDDEAAARLSDPDEVASAVQDYGDSFVSHMPVDERAEALFRRLGSSYRLAILSNWPLAWAIDHIAERSGWAEHLTAVVVSERVGWVKPHPAIFEAAAVALGVELGEMLHIGDDWAADVVGAKRAGARAVYLDARPDDSPLPTSPRDDSVEADAVIHDLLDIEAVVAGVSATGGAAEQVRAAADHVGAAADHVASTAELVDR